MNTIIIKNGILVGPDSVRSGDLAIQDGKIIPPGEWNIESEKEFRIIDAKGKYVLPGGFDPHVHLALPTPAGNSSDDFRSGSRAALAGGTTYFMDFVTPRKGQSLMEALNLRRAEAKESLTGFGLHMGISEWNPKIAAEIIPCIEKEGIRSFKAYLAYRETIGIGYKELRELMQIVGPGGGLVMVHCEEGNLISRLQQVFLTEGKTGAYYHALSRPPEAEITAIQEVIHLSEQTGCPVYIVHTSTRGGADAIAAAKRKGIEIFGETCTQYLLLNDRVYDETHENREVLPFIISPPLRTPDDQQRLWEGLADGTFDVVSTDHCPFHLKGQKDIGINDFTKIPNGAGGIEHRPALLYTYGVLTHKISLSQWVNLISTRPAEIFGSGGQKGKLLPGFDADIVIWDPEYKGNITVQNHVQNCDSDIYDGFAVRGKAHMVLLNGKIVPG